MVAGSEHAFEAVLGGAKRSSDPEVAKTATLTLTDILQPSEGGAGDGFFSR
jgi:hypothetical protein